MSLVDKLEGVHVGDLIVLHARTYIEKDGREEDRAGFVADYNSRYVALSNTYTRYNLKDGGGVRNTGFWYDRRGGEKIRRFDLSEFESYEILIKADIVGRDQQEEKQKQDNPQGVQE